MKEDLMYPRIQSNLIKIHALSGVCIQSTFTPIYQWKLPAEIGRRPNPMDMTSPFLAWTERSRSRTLLSSPPTALYWGQK